MKLEGKIALVTGGGRGIGRAISLALAREGANVIVNYVSDQQSAEETRNKIEEMGRQSIVFRADVASENEVGSMVEAAISWMGRIDILVNNAGVRSQMLPAFNHSTQAWDRVLGVHLRGAYLCCRYAGLTMAEKQFGRIVNIASLAGTGGVAFRADYGPAKAAIINLTKSLATEWARYNIRVNCVSPGIVETDLIKGANKSQYATNVEKACKRTPMRRAARPEEIASVVVFLVSEEASYVTGVNLPVDGGWTADAVGY